MNESNDKRSLTHLDAKGKVRMVDVSGKSPTERRAVAEARVRISPQLAQQIDADALAKGNLLETAKLAGIQAAKRTDELIPLCHSLPLAHVHVEARLAGSHVVIRTEAKTHAVTGVEMEALTAAAVAALTVIDMGKAVDKSMVIETIRLIEKTGGKSGDYHAPDTDAPESQT